MAKISPSALACNFAYYGNEVCDVEVAGADYIHIDVMDGHYVPNMSFGFEAISCLKGVSGLVRDVHLMIDRPERYVDRFLAAGADILTVHVEACEDIPGTLRKIRESGKRAGLCINKRTPVVAAYPYLELCDLVLVMTVEAGYGGQSFIPEMLDKVRALRYERERRSLSFEIEVDGGINAKNAADAVAAGADVLVAGSAIFGAPDRAAVIAAMKAAGAPAEEE